MKKTKNCMKIILSYFLFFCATSIFSQNYIVDNLLITDVFKDVRDGRLYRSVQIGEQIWMAENLKYEAKSGTVCAHAFTEYYETVGLLYNWETAKNVCPTGWHLPSNEEWDKLIFTLGGDSIAGGKMKSTEYWQKPNVGADNSSGFTALPSGYFGSDGTYWTCCKAFYWSSTEENSNRAWCKLLINSTKDIKTQSGRKTIKHAVRCVKD